MYIFPQKKARDKFRRQSSNIHKSKKKRILKTIIQENISKIKDLKLYKEKGISFI